MNFSGNFLLVCGGGKSYTLMLISTCLNLNVLQSISRRIDFLGLVPQWLIVIYILGLGVFNGFVNFKFALDIGSFPSQGSRKQGFESKGGLGVIDKKSFPFVGAESG